jgi:hypothetical protein
MTNINKKQIVIDFLANNKNKKYTASEIAKHLIENNPELKDKLTTQIKDRKTKTNIIAQFSAEIHSMFSSKTSSNYIQREEIKKNRYIYFYNDSKKSLITDIEKTYENSLLKDTIFFGPPGAGKSSKIKERIKDAKIYRTTFHPEYTYSDFLGQYKPVVGYHTDSNSKLDRETFEVNGKLIKGKKPVVLYDFVPGVFTKAIIEAFKNPEENIYLIIEEINRGNCAAIFGDIFQLLDRDYNNESEFPIDLPAELLDYLQSSYPEDENIQNIIKTEKLYLPRNFCILATMNTSDQSLFPMDSAFKRRWNMEYIPIDYQEKELKYSYFKIENKTHNWLKFLEKINNLIEETHNAEDKQIGQWFIKTNGIDENGTPFFNEENFKNKVLSYLFFDVFKFERSKIFKQSSFSKLIECNSLEEIFKDDVLNKNKEQETNENLENND